MKRITTLVLAALLALGGIGAAHADGIDVKVKGQWDFAFGWASNSGFKESVHGNSRDGDNDNFIARHRVRTQINFITSEHLQAVLMFEIGNLDWGRDGGSDRKVGRGSGGDLDADGVNIETKRAYLDWLIPHTDISVRMGIQGITLPATPMGSPVLDADVAGIVVNSPINDYLSIVGMWVRPFDATGDDGEINGRARRLHDETDIFGLLLPIKGDGWEINPYGLYGWVGADSGLYDYLLGTPNGTWSAVARDGNKTKIWYVGTHFELTMFDPLVFNFEAVYGRLNRIDARLPLINDARLGSAGWYLGATLDYKLDWGTPGIFGWWASGDSESDVANGKLGRLPSVMTDGSSFYPTTFGFAGTYTIGTDGVISGSPAGTWGIGLQLADVSFIEDLSHTLRVAYYRGTNDKDVPLAINFVGAGDNFYLTEKDSVFEVNFDHTYKIYENLTAVLELGYLHLKADNDVWNRGTDLDEDDDAWKAQILFQYKF